VSEVELGHVTYRKLCQSVKENIVLRNVKFITMASNSHKMTPTKVMSVGAKNLRLLDKAGWQNET